LGVRPSRRGSASRQPVGRRRRRHHRPRVSHVAPRWIQDDHEGGDRSGDGRVHAVDANARARGAGAGRDHRVHRYRVLAAAQARQARKSWRSREAARAAHRDQADLGGAIAMSRISWTDSDSHPDLDKHVEKLEHFAASLADGVISADELAKQETNLVSAMKAVESSLSDDQHAKVTKLLAELTAYSVMRIMHDL